MWRESINRSHMVITRETCDILTLEKHLFLSMASSNNETLVCMYVRGGP
jgi:hypothetical protein